MRFASSLALLTQRLARLDSPLALAAVTTIYATLRCIVYAMLSRPRLRAACRLPCWPQRKHRCVPGCRRRRVCGRPRGPLRRLHVG